MSLSAKLHDLNEEMENMSNIWNWNDGAVDYALLEKVNPVFNTAKMTLFQLAANGNAYAATLVRSMGLIL